MTLQVAVDSIGTGIRYQLGTDDNLLVPTTVSVVSSDAAAVSASGGKQTVRVYGFVGSAATGVDLHTAKPSDTTKYQVFIGNQAVIDAEKPGFR